MARPKGTNRQKTNLAAIVVPSEYWGLKAIAKRMNCSVVRLKNLAMKYHFPLVRLPVAKARSWMYYTNEMLVMAWYCGLIQNTRRYLLQNKARGTDKLRESEPFFPGYLQLPDNIDPSCIQQVTSIQACSSPAIPLGASASGTSTNPNDINELASRSAEGGGL